MMSGIRKEDIQLETTHLVEYLDDRYPFYLDPMPNLYFTRDHKRVLVEVCRSIVCIGAQDVVNLFL